MRVSGTGRNSPKLCGICALGRQHKEAETKEREKARELLSVVHSDLCGPMQTASINSERYFITFINEFSGRVSISLLHTKDGALTQFQTYRSRAENSSGKVIKALRTDGGGEYLNKEFKKYLVTAGIRHIVTPPYSPSQNGMAERMNHTIMECARCLLQDSGIPLEFWGHAFLTAVHIHNRIPSRSHNHTAPEEFWTGQQPSIGYFRVFSSRAWVHIPKERRKKLDAKSVKGILIGYEEDAGSKVYRVYSPETKSILLSRDVIIDESANSEEIQTVGDTCQKVKVQWEKATGVPEPESDTLIDPENQFHRLDSITPPPEDLEHIAESDIQETIVLRPQLAIPAPREVTGVEAQGICLTGRGQRRSQRNRGATVNLPPGRKLCAS